MTGKLIHGTNLNSVRIEVLGEGRGLTIPLSLVLAADRVLRTTFVRQDELRVTTFRDDETDEIRWIATVGNVRGVGDTPWGAVVALADALESNH